MKPAVDPKLVPFFDALAELLVAQEARLADARRVVRAIATGTESPTSPTTTKGVTTHGKENEARRATRRTK